MNMKIFLTIVGVAVFFLIIPASPPKELRYLETKQNISEECIKCKARAANFGKGLFKIFGATGDFLDYFCSAQNVTSAAECEGFGKDALGSTNLILGLILGTDATSEVLCHIMKKCENGSHGEPKPGILLCKKCETLFKFSSDIIKTILEIVGNAMKRFDCKGNNECRRVQNETQVIQKSLQKIGEVNATPNQICAALQCRDD